MLTSDGEIGEETQPCEMKCRKKTIIGILGESVVTPENVVFLFFLLPSVVWCNGLSYSQA